jgi:hypothetical protein
MRSRVVLFFAAFVALGCASRTASTSAIPSGTEITVVQCRFGIPDVISDDSGDLQRFYLSSDRPQEEWPAAAPRTFYYLNENRAITFVQGKSVRCEPIDSDLKKKVLVPFIARHRAKGE